MGERRASTSTTALVPNLQEAIPGASCYGEAVVCDTEAGDTVVVSGEDSYPLPLQSVPDIAVEVVVASQEESSAA